MTHRFLLSLWYSWTPFKKLRKPTVLTLYSSRAHIGRTCCREVSCICVESCFESFLGFSEEMSMNKVKPHPHLIVEIVHTNQEKSSAVRQRTVFPLSTRELVKSLNIIEISSQIINKSLKFSTVCYS